MLETETLTLYWAKCECCDVRTPVRLAEHMVVLWGNARGWQWHTGKANRTHHFCPNHWMEAEVFIKESEAEDDNT